MLPLSRPPRGERGLPLSPRCWIGVLSRRVLCVSRLFVPLSCAPAQLYKMLRHNPEQGPLVQQKLSTHTTRLVQPYESHELRRRVRAELVRMHVNLGTPEVLQAKIMLEKHASSNPSLLADDK